MEKCYNIVDKRDLEGFDRPLDMAEVVVMVIILIGNSVLKKIVYILR